MEDNIIKYLKSFSLNEKDYICSKINIYEKDVLLEYFNSLSDDSNLKYIEAYNQQDECIAGLCYQICVGPFPPIPTFCNVGQYGVFGVINLL